MTLLGMTQEVTIDGYVEEMGSGEKLIGANVMNMKYRNGTTTNEYGFYSLTVPAGEVSLVFSYVGYERDTLL